MQPVIVKPAVSTQKKPAKKPTKVEATSPTTVNKRVRPTPAPLKTTNAPVKTLGTSTTPVLSQAESTTSKSPSKKKKKPVRTRRPASPKPSSTVAPGATQATPTVITATTMTVNVVQGNINLNETKPPKIQKPLKDSSSKIPMSKPIIASKPMENEEGTSPDSSKNSYVNEEITLNGGTEKVETEINEVTTQTIMQNTIPVDETMDDSLHQANSQRISNRKPLVPQKDGDSDNMSTTISIANTAEETTDHEMSLANEEMEDSDEDTDEAEDGITEKYAEQIEMEDEPTVSSYSAEPQSSTIATELYLEEGTDKTETIKYTKKQKEKENSDEDSENEDDDDEDIDIGADLGLGDDDDDEDESKETTVTIKNPKEREEYDETDVVDAFLGDDDDEKDEKEEERKLSHEAPYKINPLLYRLARISSGSIATARHLPRFSEGRNRRNNKRMRFPSLAVET